MRRLLLLLFLNITPFVLQAQYNLSFNQLKTRDGLPGNFVNSIVQDADGYMWFNFRDVMARYDGYSIRRYTLDVGTDDVSYMLYCDKAGTLWVVAGGKYRIYDKRADVMTDRVNKSLPNGLTSEDVYGLWVDHSGMVWINTTDERLLRYDPAQQTTLSITSNAKLKLSQVEARGNVAYALTTQGRIFPIDLPRQRLLPAVSTAESMHTADRKTILFLDSRMRLWVYSQHQSDEPLAYYDQAARRFVAPNILDGQPITMVTSVSEDPSGRLWIGTDNVGVAVYDPQSGHAELVCHDNSYARSLASNHVNCVYIDRNAVLWVGTAKAGISFSPLHNVTLTHHALPAFSDINTLLADNEGNVWLGADGDGICRYAPSSGAYSMFNTSNSALPVDLIVCSYRDSKDRLWFGTYGGGVCYYEHGVFHKPALSSAEMSDIRCITEDRLGNIWIGTIIKGLFCYQPDGTLTSYNTSNSSITSDAINDLYCDSAGTLYVSTGWGIFSCDVATRIFTRIPRSQQAEQRLGALGVVSVFYKDSRGICWIGGNNGLVAYDDQTDSICVYDIRSGMSGNMIKGITEDGYGTLWAATDNGLTRLLPTGNTPTMPQFYCQRFDMESGSLDINVHSIMRTAQGHILVGTSAGWTEIAPNAPQAYQQLSRVVFTDLFVAGRHADADSTINGQVVLRQNISLCKSISLSNDNNSFELHVSTLHFQTQEKDRFLYRLADDDQWRPMTDNRIEFNQLQAGTYQLQVKTVDNVNDDARFIATLAITVRQPLYLSWWAILGYLLIVAAGVAYFVRHQMQKTRSKMRIRELELNAQKRQEIDEAHMRFFTNISHDLRTPLSLILIPLRNLKQRTFADNQLNESIDIMHRNAEVLMDEVNRLLDMRKLDNGKMRLNCKWGNVSELVRNTCSSFLSYTTGKNIKLEVKLPEKDVETMFDQEKLYRIINNLLSNAFKYNVENGSVRVTLTTDDGQMTLTVADTGIGIKDEDKPHVFERFYQVTEQQDRIGSGIGLHVVKECVALCGGTIDVADNIPHGTVFTVCVPLRDDTSVPADTPAPAPENVENVDATELPILIVDDNEDFRLLLTNTLKPRHHVLTASNGKEALQMLRSHQVKMVISDVMMPVMNGLELCNSIKHDSNISHIPVILLTAKTAEAHEIEGLSEGADDYIAKPFSPDILRLRIDRLLERGTVARQAFATRDIEPSEITVSSLDEQLLQKAISEVEKNIADEDYTVEQLAEAVGITRGHLYKKLVAITGKTPVEFIRILRIKRGRQLLEQSQRSVSEIAYSVGLSPRIFTKYFKEMYNQLPSDYKRKDD